ncbi:MAG: hypothetical protein R3267_12390 [Paenisporosarcina sp.]|nr:hypothetical protein [Paenisporosarcina sp.]
MGLYINSGKHPDILKNLKTVVEVNQASFRQDTLTDLLEEQQKTNELLQQSYIDLKDVVEKHAIKQTSRWKYVQSKMNHQRQMNSQQKNLDHQVLENLKKVEAKQGELQATLDNHEPFTKDFMNMISQANQEVLLKLTEAEEANTQLQLKVDEQVQLQNQLVQQLAKQQEIQMEMGNRLENQEAFMEKIMRQIDYFRSVLFERTNYLAEKIDAGYTTFTQMLTGKARQVKQEPQMPNKEVE